MQQWFAVHTLPSGEQKALLNLRNQGFAAYLPHYMKVRRHARRIDRVKAPLFPRYLFVRIDLESQRWRLVNSTYGVSYIVSNRDRPTPVSDALIAEIQAREDDMGAVVLNRITPLKPGDRVRFIDGPMIDHVGIFECDRDDDRVTVLLDLIGRTNRVTTSRNVIMSCA